MTFTSLLIHAGAFVTSVFVGVLAIVGAWIAIKDWPEFDAPSKFLAILCVVFLVCASVICFIFGRSI